MDRRLALGDRAASQILGFIVGLVVVTGSLAITTYFITTAPDNAPDEESRELQGNAQRAVDVLTATAGQPPDWHEGYSDDDLRRVGLLREGESAWFEREKIELIQDGTLTTDRILRSWDLNHDELGARIEGRVQSVPIGEVPERETFGVVHADRVDGFDYTWTVYQSSRDAAELFAGTDAGYDFDAHHWQLGKTTHPSNGLGDSVIDHAYFVETQLFPKMAGIEATYSTADHAGGPWGNAEAADWSMDNYTESAGGPDSATRWHVVAEEKPYKIPGHSGSNDDHVLTVNWRMITGSEEDDGVGKWRVADGASSFALLEAVDTTGVSSAELSFDHLLKVETEDRDVCSGPGDTSCVRIRPSIAFWNTTGTAEWTRLENNPSGCGASNVWDDWGGAETTSNDWDPASVNLCEALAHSDETLWLGFYWDTLCVDDGPSPDVCDGEDADNAAHGWFVDNIEVTAGGETLYETDFEPPRENPHTLFVSNGVDHNRTYAPGPDDAEENTIAYLRNAVENGTSVVAVAPDHPSPDTVTPGEWLSQIGLSTAKATPGEDVLTREPENTLMRFPHDLPEESTDYRSENVSWQTGQPSTPNSWSLPDGFRELTAVQTHTSELGTMLIGKPYVDGGGVAAIAYNYSSFEDETLREELYDNLYSGSVLLDPSFEVGDELPDAGTTEVLSDRRVGIVSVTDDGTYVVPLEVTVWLWNRG